MRAFLKRQMIRWLSPAGFHAFFWQCTVQYDTCKQPRHFRGRQVFAEFGHYARSVSANILLHCDFTSNLRVMTMRLGVESRTCDGVDFVIVRATVKL
jgi:hypothetical protein